MLIKNRLVTTRQKKYVEKTLDCLGINIDELMLINNLSNIIKHNEELELKIKEQQKQVEVLTKALEVSAENISRLAGTIQEVILKMEKNAYSQIFESFDEEVTEYYNKGSDN